MKTIEPIQIWDNGQIKTASILNANAVSVLLNKNATFNYQLISLNDDQTINETITAGSIFMDYDQYQNWSQDEFAWDFVANSLNLVITGDYTPPQNIDQPVENNPESL